MIISFDTHCINELGHISYPLNLWITLWTQKFYICRSGELSMMSLVCIIFALKTLLTHRIFTKLVYFTSMNV